MIFYKLVGLFTGKLYDTILTILKEAISVRLQKLSNILDYKNVLDILGIPSGEDIFFERTLYLLILSTNTPKGTVNDEEIILWYCCLLAQKYFKPDKDEIY